MIQRHERRMTLRPICLGSISRWITCAVPCLGFPTPRSEFPCVDRLQAELGDLSALPQQPHCRLGHGRAARRRRALSQLTASESIPLATGTQQSSSQPRVCLSTNTPCTYGGSRINKCSAPLSTARSYHKNKQADGPEIISEITRCLWATARSSPGICAPRTAGVSQTQRGFTCVVPLLPYHTLHYLSSKRRR